MVVSGFASLIRWRIAMFFFSEAFAQAAQAVQKPSLLEQLVFPVLVLGFFYFAMIRPQSKRQKALREFVAGLKRGDAVMTSGGILGRVY
jgi:preprotein translocase subunit YajC